MAELPGFYGLVPVFFKTFLRPYRARLVTNEVYAYLAARVIGAPAAPLFAVLCGRDEIEMWMPQALLGSNPADPWVLGVATLDENPHGFSQQIADNPRTRAEIVAWPSAPLAAAYDELILNPDRQGNMLRIAPAQFRLLDQEACFGGRASVGRWSTENAPLDTVYGANYIAKCIACSTDEDAKHAMVGAAGRHVKEAQFSRIPCQLELLRACGMPMHVHDKYIEFLTLRQALVQRMLYSYIQLSQLVSDETVL